VDRQTTADHPIPNHHRDHPGFSGIRGACGALTFLIGRKPAARLAAELAGVGADDTVVDIGCGPGVAARHAASLGATVVGVDPATVMLRVARLLGWAGRVRYLVGTAESLPVLDASATVVWSLSTVHHWRDVDAGLGEVHRVLRPTGRVLAIEKLVPPGATGHASHGWTQQQADAFAERLAGHGFTDTVVEHHPGRRPTLSVRAVRP
jgi:ubiquinone/menaquinone biosynthesis C-methylase UbiE